MLGKSFIILSFLLAACSTVQLGRDFDPAAFDARVQRGVTTQTEVRDWLGAPSSVGVSVESDGERFEKWTYYYGVGELPSMTNARIKILEIRFDPQYVVRAYTWSSGQ
ncbi:MAG TPA: hypothetical protein VMG60_11640 [Burkholderiaceae bacterium]|nr:hypothetical protein [Burkholderiaceae bacterium]